MYLILHAFSGRNAGDNLLVELTLEVMENAGVPRSDIEMIALDPETFDLSIPIHRAPSEPFGRISPRLVGAGFQLAMEIISKGRIGAVSRVVQQARGIVAVGGGYLVANSYARQAGVLINHMTQLSAAARSNVPTIYLPQSIGPLNKPIAALVRRRLANLDRVYVRDNESVSELGLANTKRIGDLAVMKLARDIGQIKPPEISGPPIIIARNLPSPINYQRSLTSLAGGLGNAKWAIQADAPGSRGDPGFYKELGYRAEGRFSDILSESQPGVVVSVRLHGAIAALLAGWPAIHLAYERKGWGAYEDLGIQDYVHDARQFDHQRVLDQVKELASDPLPFWSRIVGSSAKLVRQYDEMVSDLRGRLIF